MDKKTIPLGDETVINDAVRLYKFAFVGLYHEEFKFSVGEAEYAWHKCRASRAGQLLALQLGREPVSPARLRALAAAVPRAPRPRPTKDWKRGDVIHFTDQRGREWTTPILRVFVYTDDKEYAQYRNEGGGKAQVLVTRAELVRRVGDQPEVCLPLLPA